MRRFLHFLLFYFLIYGLHRLRGRELFALLIRYNAVKVIPELLRYNLYSIQDAVQQIAATFLSNEVPNPRTAAAARGLQQLYATLRYYLRHPASPTAAIPVAFLLSTLSSLRVRDTDIFEPPLLEALFHLILHSSSFSSFAAVPFPPSAPVPPAAAAPAYALASSAAFFPSSFSAGAPLEAGPHPLNVAVRAPLPPFTGARPPPSSISFPTYSLPPSLLAATSPAAIVLERALVQVRGNGFPESVGVALEDAFDRLPGKPRRPTFLIGKR